MQKLRLDVMLSGIVTLIAVMIMWGAWFTVSPGKVGVLTRMGAIQPVIYSEGAHFKLPFIETDHEISVKTVTYDATALDASTKDLQQVTSDMAVLYSIDRPDALDVFRNYRDLETLEQRAIRPSVEEVIKAVTARYTAEELITRRQDVRTDIINMMKQKLESHYVHVNDIAITNFKFSPAFNQAIEAKVTAEQQALKAQNDLQRIKIEAEQRIAQATAEAEAIKVQADAIQKQGGPEYVQLKFIEKWDGKLPQYGTVPAMFKAVQ